MVAANRTLLKEVRRLAINTCRVELPQQCRASRYPNACSTVPLPPSEAERHHP